MNKNNILNINGILLGLLLILIAVVLFIEKPTITGLATVTK